jgi:hypothetical protein
MSDYYLVFNLDLNRAIALAKVEHRKATILAGEGMAECTFENGEPGLDYGRNWFPVLLTKHSWHPTIGHYIDKLGLPQDSQAKLDAWKDKRGKRMKAEELTADELERIRTLKKNNISQRKIAELLGVSKAFVQRLDCPDPPTL